MVLLELLGVIGGAALVNSAAKKHQQKANPKLDRTKFDANNAQYGVASSPMGYREQQIVNIAARCGVKPSKDGVLPENGWKSCISYISNYINNPDDINNFINDWHKTIVLQLKRKSEMMKNKYWEEYQKQYNGYLNNKEFWISGPAITLEYKHWHGLPKDQYIQRLKDLQTKTFWGELALKDPILRNNPHFKDSFIEVWVMRGDKYDRQDSWVTKNSMTTLYKCCCRVCGYDPML